MEAIDDAVTSWDRSFDHFDKGTAGVLTSLFNVGGTRKS